MTSESLSFTRFMPLQKIWKDEYGHRTLRLTSEKNDLETSSNKSITKILFILQGHILYCILYVSMWMWLVFVTVCVSVYAYMGVYICTCLYECGHDTHMKIKIQHSGNSSFLFPSFQEEFLLLFLPTPWMYSELAWV